MDQRSLGLNGNFEFTFYACGKKLTVLIYPGNPIHNPLRNLSFLLNHSAPAEKITLLSKPFVRRLQTHRNNKPPPPGIVPRDFLKGTTACKEATEGHLQEAR
ncbi:hypothetical protein MKW98_010112 [Papaver atlanticum]|uniref:Uncharacterized protein n=1 Tax=Papaver atlanticum TaxID=357466 RepID=A0AAD4RXH6_9MAGN|nr:hypothetical protein MKW98_010112 [Papaver atlanticum]